MKAVAGWAPRDARALIALAASVAGAAVLTGLAAWLAWILWRGGWPAATASDRIAALGRSLLATLAIIGAVLLSLGLAINRRSLHARAFGASLEASGGDEDIVTDVTVRATRSQPDG